MKSVKLTYHDDFPWSPISGWVGARQIGYVLRKTESGQPKRPGYVIHPFLLQRRKWCLLTVEFERVELRFAFPRELDEFISVMTQNPLPSGSTLIKGRRLGRPNNHWLSRLPKKTKPLKFRKAICDYLGKAEGIITFREFYEADPVETTFEGVFDYIEAHRLWEMELENQKK